MNTKINNYLDICIYNYINIIYRKYVNIHGSYYVHTIYHEFMLNLPLKQEEDRRQHFSGLDLIAHITSWKISYVFLCKFKGLRGHFL